MKTYKWLRVTKAQRCAICGKPDYCTYAPEANLALCMRIESDRPSKNVMGGFLHRLDGEHRPPNFISDVHEKPARDSADLVRMYESWKPLTTAGLISDCANDLALDALSLHYFGWRWTGYAWAVPMYSPDMKLLGIRLRAKDGKKWSVKGSHQGLFIPTTVKDWTLMISEGATDAAAALTLGFFSIGRPSCQGLHDMVLSFIRLHKISRVILISDNDPPGLLGSEKLQSEMPVSSVRWIPPAKDLREFVKAGGSREIIESQIQDMVWKVPMKRAIAS